MSERQQREKESKNTHTHTLIRNSIGALLLPFVYAFMRETEHHTYIYIRHGQKPRANRTPGPEARRVEGYLGMYVHDGLGRTKLLTRLTLSVHTCMHACTGLFGSGVVGDLSVCIVYGRYVFVIPYVRTWMALTWHDMRMNLTNERRSVRGESR